MKLRKQGSGKHFLLLFPVMALVFFLGVGEALALTCSGTYSTTLSGSPLTITLNQSAYSGIKTLSGNASYNSVTFNINGFIDSSNNCFVWVWYNYPSASGVLAGKLTETTGGNGATTAIFDFGGGQNSSGRFDRIVIPDMQKSDTASTATIASASVATSSYSGVYSGTFSGVPVTVNLTQSNVSSGTTLSGTFLFNNIPLTAGGFVDANNNAFVWVWFSGVSNIGSGVVAGKLTKTSGNVGTIDFGGGYVNENRIGQFVFNELQPQSSGMPFSTVTNTITVGSSVPSTAASSVTMVMSAAGTTTPGGNLDVPRAGAGASSLVLATNSAESVLLAKIDNSVSELSADSTALAFVYIALTHTRPSEQFDAMIRAATGYANLVSLITTSLSSGSSPLDSADVVQAVQTVASHHISIDTSGYSLHHIRTL